MMTEQPRWMALPQPTTAALTGGSWRPAAVQVITDDPALTREAARLERELGTLGIPNGDGAFVRLLRDERGAATPESFQIEVRGDIDVRVPSAVGAFRATRQILHNLRAQDAVPCGNLRSDPVVRERGLHLDAARKYFPAASILELLHTVADIGINVVQWHLSENEGFRIGSEQFPSIVSPEHVSRADVLRIADTATELQIDLIPSLDMPGHLGAVLAAHPELRLHDADGHPLSDALDITRAEAITFAHQLIDDIAPLFPHSTRWNLGGDEFVDFARIDDYPVLDRAARERFGEYATGFDVLTDFVNSTADHLRARGFDARVWNDGMLRGRVVGLDPEVALTWWTNWHVDMSPLAAALSAGNPLVNFNDGLFYYVLGEKAGYTYPTSARIWDADWHPGLFPSLPGGARQEITAPYPPALLGSAFSVWADDEEEQSVEQVFDGIRSPLRAMAERAWNGGSGLTVVEFDDIDARIGHTPALDTHRRTLYA